MPTTGSIAKHCANINTELNASWKLPLQLNSLPVARLIVDNSSENFILSTGTILAWFSRLLTKKPIFVVFVLWWWCWWQRCYFSEVMPNIWKQTAVTGKINSNWIQILQYNGFYIYLANREFVSVHAALLGIFFFLEKRFRIFDFVKEFNCF